jgi:electron transfer flavoprotein beta subunit
MAMDQEEEPLMNVVVCCKFVPCIQDIQKKPDGSLSWERAVWQISDYDLQAIQAGLDLAAATGGKLTAVTVGSAEIRNGRLRKDLLSRGPGELYAVVDDSLPDADIGVISALLAAMIKKIGADIVVCGEGSADYYYQQTGLQLGERLGWPCLNGVNAIEVGGDGRLLVERVREDAVDSLSAPLPAVLCVTSSINAPERPTMKAVLAAGKKPYTEWSADEVGTGGQQSSLVAESTVAPFSARRKNIVLEGEPEETAAQLIRCLKADGVLI